MEEDDTKHGHHAEFHLSLTLGGSSAVAVEVVPQSRHMRRQGLWAFILPKVLSSAEAGGGNPETNSQALLLSVPAGRVASRHQRQYTTRTTTQKSTKPEEGGPEGLGRAQITANSSKLSKCRGTSEPSEVKVTVSGTGTETEGVLTKTQAGDN